jgi:hypothetical protein
VKIGFVHPAVRDVARAIGRLGWKVTSTYRPGAPTHGRGIALDVAPIEPEVGTFHLRTALLMWQVAHHVRPDLAWLAMSERDHVHINIAKRDMYGIQLASEPRRFYDAITHEEIPMFENFPQAAIGDHETVLAETGDAGTEIVQMEGGDYCPLGDVDLEAGDVKRRQSVGQIARSWAVKGRVNAKQLAAIRRANPRAAAIAVAAAKHFSAQRSLWCRFEYAEGARINNTSLRLDSKLRPFELASVRTHITEAPLVQPPIIQFTNPSAGVWELEVDAALVSQLGLPAGALFRYVGFKILFVASPLNSTPGGQVTVSKELGSGNPPVVTTIFIGSGKVSSLTGINGAIVAGEPRYFGPLVPAAASASGNYTIRCTGVSPNYTVTGRFFLPGDNEVDKFVALLD